MRKIIRRKGLAALMAVGIILFYSGGYFAWDGVTHRGAGRWKFGGDDNYGGFPTDEYYAKVTEKEYRRQCYAAAEILFLLGGLILWNSIKSWREKNALEEHWKKIIKHDSKIDDIHRNPDAYREDFKQWLKENRPDLCFWELPRNSSN